MYPKISAIIPTYNEHKAVLEAIESLLQQTLPLTEIIVVDNASTDGTSELIKRMFSNHKKVKLVSMSSNTGVTGGRNKGLEYASGSYVLFFDHDMVAEKHMVEELLKVAESKKEVGIVTPKIFYWEKKNIIWSAGTDVNLWTGQTLFRGGEDKGQYEKTEEVAVAPAVLLVKKTVIDKIGAFNPIYVTTYEDTDFCFRAKRNGFLTFYTQKAVAWHKIPYNTDISNKRLLARTYWVARNRLLFMKRYGKSYPLFILFVPIFMLYYLRLSFKYRRLDASIEYLKGVFSGFISK